MPKKSSPKAAKKAAPKRAAKKAPKKASPKKKSTGKKVSPTQCKRVLPACIKLHKESPILSSALMHKVAKLYRAKRVAGEKKKRSGGLTDYNKFVKKYAA